MILLANDTAVFRRKTANFSVFKKLMKLAGTINKSSWFGYSAGTWLCSRPSADKIGTIWKITCVFNYRQSGWNWFPLFNGSYKYKRIYSKRDFNKLRFTKEDFINEPSGGFIGLDANFAKDFKKAIKDKANKEPT